LSCKSLVGFVIQNIAGLSTSTNQSINQSNNIKVISFISLSSPFGRIVYCVCSFSLNTDENSDDSD
jgi:hypothetical protein